METTMKRGERRDAAIEAATAEGVDSVAARKAAFETGFYGNRKQRRAAAAHARSLAKAHGLKGKPAGVLFK